MTDVSITAKKSETPNIDTDSNYVYHNMVLSVKCLIMTAVMVHLGGHLAVCIKVAETFHLKTQMSAESMRRHYRPTKCNGCPPDCLFNISAWTKSSRWTNFTISQTVFKLKYTIKHAITSLQFVTLISVFHPSPTSRYSTVL